MRSKKSQEDEKWYKACWESKSPQSCAECGIILPWYNRMFVSHIISKGSNPALRNHPRNFMIYCHEHHQQWEFGDRKAMKTYNEAQRIAQELTKEYYEN